MNIESIKISGYDMLEKGAFGLVNKSKAKLAINYVSEQTSNFYKKEKQEMISSYGKKIKEKDEIIFSQKNTITKEKTISQILQENVNSAKMGLRYLNKLLKTRIKLGDASVIDYSKNDSCEYIKIKQMEFCDTTKNESLIKRLRDILESNYDKNVIILKDEKTGNAKYRIFPSYDKETKKLKYVSIYKLNPNKQESMCTSEYHISFQNDKVSEATCILGNASEYTLFKDLDSKLRTKTVSYRENDGEYAKIEYV